MVRRWRVWPWSGRRAREPTRGCGRALEHSYVHVCARVCERVSVCVSVCTCACALVSVCVCAHGSALAHCVSSECDRNGACMLCARARVHVCVCVCVRARVRTDAWRRRFGACTSAHACVVVRVGECRLRVCRPTLHRPMRFECLRERTRACVWGARAPTSVCVCGRVGVCAG